MLLAAWSGSLLLGALIVLAIWAPANLPPVIERTFSRGPTPIERDSLAALAATGTTVRWRGTVQPVAMELDPDAAGTIRVAVTAPETAPVRAGDALGTLDSTRANRGGARFALRGAISPLTVVAAGESLRAGVRHPTVKAVAVFGAAGWEARFLVEALEAAGLPVVARLQVAPQTWVTQGRALPLDTVRHAVALVLGRLDQSAAGQVRAFVRSGGGAVLAPGATGLDDLAPGRFGSPLRTPASLSLPSTREQLVIRPLTRLLPGADALDGTDGNTVTAIRRMGAGRVVQLADEDTWRLVLASDAGRAGHTGLWLRAIALAFPRPVGRPAVDDNVAPLAGLTAAVGPASPNVETRFAAYWEPVIALLLFAALVGEWAVRRLGGRP